MIELLTQAFVALQASLFESVVQPVLFALGLTTYAELGFDAVEFFLYGVIEIALVWLLLRPLESLRPVERWTDRRAVRVDVLYTLLNRLGLIPLLVFMLLAVPIGDLDGWLRLHDLIPGNLEDWLPELRERPWLSFAAYLLIIDLNEYWRHRLQHRFDFWWALHSVHHSQRQMSFWSDSRNHLLDDLIQGVWMAAVSLLIGVPPAQFVLILLVTRAVENLSHANLRLGFSALGERLLVSPRFHRTHHAIGAGLKGRYRGCNFAVLFPLWDLLFGTARFDDAYAATGIGDQLQGAEYGEGFWQQQTLGVKRLLAALAPSSSSHRTADDAYAAGCPQTVQAGSLPSWIARQSAASASNSNNRPSSDWPMPATSLSASAACMVPMMPVSGANTPITAQRTSSTSSPSGNRQ